MSNIMDVIMDVDRKTYMSGLVAMFGNEIQEVLKEQGYTIVKTESLNRHLRKLDELDELIATLKEQAKESQQ